MQETDLAVILVAGVGSRLRGCVGDIPKALVPIGGETILGRACRLLEDCGVKHVVLATGYKAESVKAALRGCRLSLSFCHNADFSTTQNVASLAACGPAFRGRGFFKLDGDVVFEGRVLERLRASDADLAVAVDSKRELDEEAMKVKLSPKRGIEAFGKALPLTEDYAETLGIERIGAELSSRLASALEAALRQGRSDIYYEQIYDELLGDPYRAEAVEVGDLRWAEVDDAADLNSARAMF